MSEKMTALTALRIESDNLNDPNSGFYPPQGTTEQIENIPADAKAEGELLYNTTTGSLMYYDGADWKTLNSSDGDDGDLVAESHAADPDPRVSGLIYYNTGSHQLKTQNNVATNTIVTTPDVHGNYVVKSHAADPEPNQPGLIYYETAFHQLKTQNNVAANTIVTTPDVNGNYVVKSHAADPEPNQPGLIYYDTATKALKTHQDNLTVEIGKPAFGYYFSIDPKTTALTVAENAFFSLDIVEGTFVSSEKVLNIVAAEANKYGIKMQLNDQSTLYQIIVNFSLRVTVGHVDTGRSIEIRLREFTADDFWVIQGSEKKCTLYNSDSISMTISSLYQFQGDNSQIIVEARTNVADCTVELGHPNFSIVPIA
jgi:hypothetical protein